MAELQLVVEMLAGAQDGVISRQQLLAEGVSPTAFRRAIERRQLLRIHPGVVRAAGAPRSGRQALWAAYLAAGRGAAVSHGSAASLWGFEAVRRCPPTISVPHRRTPKRPQGVVVHRRRQLPSIDITESDGLPLTTPARTVVDLAAECSRPRLGALLDAAHFDRAVRYSEVGEALLRLGHPGRRGAARLCDLLDDRTDGDNLSASALERLLSDLLRVAGVENVVRQHPVLSQRGLEGIVDGFIVDAALIVEGDGRRWHSRQADMKRDRERDFVAAQQGILTVRLLWEHLRGDLEGCAEGLRRVIATRTGAAAPGAHS